MIGILYTKDVSFKDLKLMQHNGVSNAMQSGISNANNHHTPGPPFEDESGVSNAMENGISNANNHHTPGAFNVRHHLSSLLVVSPTPFPRGKFLATMSHLRRHLSSPFWASPMPFLRARLEATMWLLRRHKHEGEVASPTPQNASSNS
ncbi:hypothetical protein HN51_055152 [Arachis hypogaea]